MAGDGWWTGFESIDQPGRSSEVERNPKTSILFFWLFKAGEGWWMGFESIDQPSQSPEVEHNPKMSFNFLAGEGWWMGFKSIYPFEIEIHQFPVQA